MRTILSLRLTLTLIVLGLNAAVGFCGTQVPVGTSGPLTAFRVKAPLGWAFQIRNDSAARESAHYAVHGRPALTFVPALDPLHYVTSLVPQFLRFQYAPTVPCGPL